MMPWGVILFVLGLMGEAGARGRRHPTRFTIHDFFVLMYATGFILIVSSLSFYVFGDMP